MGAAGPAGDPRADQAIRDLIQGWVKSPEPIKDPGGSSDPEKKKKKKKGYSARRCGRFSNTLVGKVDPELCNPLASQQGIL